METARDHSIDEIAGLVTQGRYANALAMIAGIGAPGEQALYNAGRLAALEWYCRYQLDDDIEADEIVDHVADEMRGDYLAGFGIQLSEIDALHLAEPVLERLTVATPGDERAWYNYGYLLLKSEEWDRAIEAFGRARELKPSLALCHWSLGECYQAIGEHEAAAEAYRSFLELEPDDLDALVLGGIACSDAGIYEAACAMLEKAISIDPGNLSAHFNLAVIAARTGNRERLRELREEIAAIAPDNWRVEIVDARLHEADGAYPESLACRKDALSIAVDDEDWSASDTIAAGALAFARRHGFADHASPLIDTVFRHQLFSENVLLEMRELTEPRLEEASCFRIMLEGRIPAAVLDEENGKRPEDEDLGYFRSVCVFAETEATAQDIAFDFERRSGGQPVAIENLEDLGKAHDVCQGVYWCQQGLSLFPLDEPDET